MSKRNKKRSKRGNFKDHGGARNKPREISPQAFFDTLARELHTKFNGKVPPDKAEFGFIMLVFPFAKTSDAVTVTNTQGKHIEPILRQHADQRRDAESPIIMPPGAK